MVVAEAGAAIVARMDYDEYGRVLVNTQPGLLPFGFAGGLYDADTRLVRFGVRDYDAQAARWAAKDATRFAGGSTNLYLYADSDAINGVDPSGQRSPEECSTCYHYAYGAYSGCYTACEAKYGKGGSPPLPEVFPGTCPAPTSQPPTPSITVGQCKNDCASGYETQQTYCTDLWCPK
jgi:RHS repeat-associated protein